MAVSSGNEHKKTNKQVEERLITAAEELFCDNGFDATSVRDLTSRADCNVAAINYYFGGKDNLYIEVFRRRLVAMTKLRLESINSIMSCPKSRVTLEELLRVFATAFIEPLVAESGGRRFMKLMTREMIDPHLPRSLFIEKMIVPTMSTLGGALQKICPELDPTKNYMCIFSFIGQLVHLVRLKEMFEEYEQMKKMYDFEKTVEHIVEFSTAGILAAAKRKSDV